MNIDKYILCLDTNKYAGNFEQDTTAYATGIYGDCGRGDDKAEEFKKADIPQDIVLEIERKILSVADDHGCHRPCKIQPSPDWVNNGMGVHYRQSKNTPPTDEQIMTYRDLCRESKQSSLNMAIHNKWPQENINVYEQELQAVETSVPRWYPAYNSVGIFFCEPLSDAAFKVVLNRAMEYLTREDITLEKVRLITLFTDEKSELLYMRTA